MSHKIHNRNMVLGVVMSAVGAFAALAMPSMAILLTLGILLILFATLQWRRPIVRVCDDHLEVRLTPTASIREVLYRNITATVRPKDNVMRLIYDEPNGELATLDLDIKIFDPGVAARLMAFLDRVRAQSMTRNDVALGFARSLVR